MMLHACTCLPRTREVPLTPPHAHQVLINNAGVALPPHKITEDGFEVGNTCCSSLVTPLVAVVDLHAMHSSVAHCVTWNAESASAGKGRAVSCCAARCGTQQCTYSLLCADADYSGSQLLWACVPDGDLPAPLPGRDPLGSAQNARVLVLECCLPDKLSLLRSLLMQHNGLKSR